MSIKTIVVCDGCGQELKSKSERYKLILQTDRFWNSVEMDYLREELHFCYKCATQIKDTLTKIAEKKGGQQDAME